MAENYTSGNLWTTAYNREKKQKVLDAELFTMFINVVLLHLE